MRHGSKLNPPNRFEAVHREADVEHVAVDDDYLAELDHHAVEYLPDDSQSIVSENNSPDIPFHYSVNPYRGCAHGWPYFAFPLGKLR